MQTVRKEGDLQIEALSNSVIQAHKGDTQAPVLHPEQFSLL